MVMLRFRCHWDWWTSAWSWKIFFAFLSKKEGTAHEEDLFFISGHCLRVIRRRGKLCPRDELAVRRHGGLYGDGCRRFDYRVSDAGFGTVQFFRQGNDGRLLGRAKPQALWFQSTPVHLQKYQPEPLLRRRVLKLIRTSFLCRGVYLAVSCMSRRFGPQDIGDGWFKRIGAVLRTLSFYDLIP